MEKKTRHQIRMLIADAELRKAALALKEHGFDVGKTLNSISALKQVEDTHIKNKTKYTSKQYNRVLFTRDSIAEFLIKCTDKMNQ